MTVEYDYHEYLESQVRLHLMRWSHRLVCAVRDPSPASPNACDTDDFSAESGRGLFLIDSFSDSWGWHPLSGAAGGKVVWALFRMARPAGQEAGQGTGQGAGQGAGQGMIPIQSTSGQERAAERQSPAGSAP
jgi:hypothetical protein